MCMDPVQSSGFTTSYASEAPKMSWGVKKILVYFGLAFIGFVAYVWVNSPMVVTVTGSGEVSVPATNATVSFTLSATDNSINSAVTAVSAKASSMRSFLKTKGIAEGDIAQSQVIAVPASLVTAGATGFQATISMAAKTTHVSEVSNLVADLYSNGAVVVAQPVLSVENQGALSQAAFDAALKDAKLQAAAIGNKNLKFIRKIVSVSQVSSPTTSTSTTRAEDTNTNAQASANGVFKIVSAVSVSYKMW